LREWEIIKNLDKVKLTTLETGEYLAEFATLANPPILPISEKKQPRRAVARLPWKELGMDQPDFDRALKIASLSPDAKQFSRENGLDNNQSVLLAAANSENPIACLQQGLAEESNSRNSGSFGR
jgi:hypothetical protein